MQTNSCSSPNSRSKKGNEENEIPLKSPNKEIASGVNNGARGKRQGGALPQIFILPSNIFWAKLNKVDNQDNNYRAKKT